MNRREFAKSTSVVAAMGVLGSIYPLVVKGRSFAKCDRDSCANFLESTAREIMEETGEWKEVLVRTRPDSVMLITRLGCCGCEISLPKGAHHPDWVYRRRGLTAEEQNSFQEEYGRQAALLLGMNITPTARIRGFILNGRKAGWNLSIKSLT